MHLIVLVSLAHLIKIIKMMCDARYKRYWRVVVVFFPSSGFVHCFLLSFVSPSFTPLVLDNRPKKHSHPSSATSMCAKSVLLYLPNPIYLQHDQQSGKWSPISRDIITHGSSLRPHSVQLSMEPEPNHPSLPSYCVCVYMLDVAKSQHITPFVALSPPLAPPFSCILSNSISFFFLLLHQVLTTGICLPDSHLWKSSLCFLLRRKWKTERDRDVCDTESKLGVDEGMKT